MSYFKQIVTNAIITNWEAATKEHEEKLNNYVKYGMTLTNAAYEKVVPEYRPSVVKREIKNQSSYTITRAGDSMLILGTVLCCEDEAYDEKGEA